MFKMLFYAVKLIKCKLLYLGRTVQYQHCKHKAKKKKTIENYFQTLRTDNLHSYFFHHFLSSTDFSYTFTLQALFKVSKFFFYKLEIILKVVLPSRCSD